MIGKLKRIVEDNCISKDGNISTLAYWSDVVFAKSVFILAPLSLLAIIPAVIICLQTETYLILWFDIFCLFMLIFVGYVPLISVKTRKIILILLMFLTAFVLLKELGNFGPGLAYLLSGTIFSLLLFPTKKTFAPFILTLVLCIIYGFLIHYKFVEIQAKNERYLMEWFAVSSNVLFMSAVFSLMIPFFFTKLEGILGEKTQLLESIRKTNLELQKSIEEVNSKNLELEQFAYVASHDLQEPLRMITSFMDKLKLKYANQLDDKALQYIYYAMDGATRMRKIILDLLEYSRVGRLNEISETFAVTDIIEEYQFLRKQLIIEKNVTIIVGKMPIIQCFRSPFIQTIHGLIDNAIKYSKENIPPKVTIFSEEYDDYFKIFVQDNGIGIDPRFHEKIFVIFQRLHNKEIYEGTGIGLAIVKKQVESWGGKIGLVSKIDEGSTFYYTIPKNIKKS